MYRATVEQVNGLYLRAGGKWLTCIGNRNLKVGDKIWTDGRCVYGNYVDCQQPIVITKPPDEDVGIPVGLGKIYYYRLDKDIVIADIPNDISPIPNRLTNNKTLLATGSQNKGCLASNIDSKSNSYCIYLQKDLLSLLKNRKVFKTFSLSTLEEQVQSIAEAALESKVSTIPYANGGSPARYIVYRDVFSGNGYTGPVSEWVDEIQYHPLSRDFKSGSRVISAFIENETNWWVLVSVSGSGYARGEKLINIFSDPIVKYTLIFAGSSWWIDPVPISVETGATNIYLIDNSGTHLLFQGVSRYCDDRIDLHPSFPDIREKSGLPWSPRTYYYEDRVISYNVAGLINKIFPLQDGFYYKINKILDSAPRYHRNFSPPSRAEITIYSPSDVPILTRIFRIGVYISVYQFKPKKFLIAVLNATDVGGSKKGVLEDGLYLYQDTELSKIASGTITNQCLRPMRHYKNWWQRIHSLD